MRRKKFTDVRAKAQAERDRIERAKALAHVELDPRWTALEQYYSIPDLLAKLPKRFVNEAFDELLLDVIAERKARGRGYMDLQSQFGKTPRQLVDFVYRHRRKLDRKIKQLKSLSR